METAEFFFLKDRNIIIQRKDIEKTDYYKILIPYSLYHIGAIYII